MKPRLTTIKPPMLREKAALYLSQIAALERGDVLSEPTAREPVGFSTAPDDRYSRASPESDDEATP